VKQSHHQSTAAEFLICR